MSPRPVPLSAPSWRRIVPAFVAAVLVAAAWGSAAQTQVTLNALVALDVAMPWGLRLQTTLRDLVGFGPIYAGVVTVAWLPAFAVAGWLARRVPGWRPVLFAVAAGVALLAAFAFADVVAPMPVFIDATRGWGGTLAMALGGVLGGALYARWTRRIA
ncbi:MAG TPA: hypothetical protein VMR43_18655 [Variovorax sp.]|nr:hypothetical protein [Variovorax sp.]